MINENGPHSGLISEFAGKIYWGSPDPPIKRSISIFLRSTELGKLNGWLFYIIIGNADHNESIC